MSSTVMEYGAAYAATPAEMALAEHGITLDPAEGGVVVVVVVVDTGAGGGYHCAEQVLK